MKVFKIIKRYGDSEAPVASESYLRGSIDTVIKHCVQIAHEYAKLMELGELTGSEEYLATSDARVTRAGNTIGIEDHGCGEEPAPARISWEITED